ncbi:MAG: enoyl-CoA hydratase/isomerase family protein [Betaproteobacteria bacterium]|nr:enoyl-CoA hydratase/isomerase family protein [Betaproteobacteria bacterium]
MSEPTLQIEIAGGIATVWLNRPDLRNAFDETVIAEIHAAFESLAADTGVRAVVLAGRGTAFCAGANLNWMKRMAGFSVEENRADAMALARMLQRIHTLPKPTIARVHGAAFAGGLGLVCVCDIAIASTEAQFRLSEVRLGLTPATISPYVINAIGERQARRYFLTAEAFDAAEALRIGLVHETVAREALDERVAYLAAQLAQGSPAALAASKELIDAVARAPLDDALIADTAVRIAEARASAEGKEGVRAFLEKRRPAWLAGSAPRNPGARP